MTIFEAIKQLELDDFCDLMYGTVNGAHTKKELKKMLQNEISEEELRRINEAARREGRQPLSFSLSKL